MLIGPSGNRNDSRKDSSFFRRFGSYSVERRFEFKRRSLANMARSSGVVDMFPAAIWSTNIPSMTFRKVLSDGLFISL